MKKILVISCVACMYAFTGCASIVTGSTQKMSFKSIPESSSIKITNEKGEDIHVGKTPMIIDLRKGAGYFKPASYKITFSKEGFQTTVVNVKGKVNGWYLGNVLFGGVIGILIVDPLTGAMFTLNPKDIKSVLNENNINIDSNEQTLTIFLKEKISEEVMARATELSS